MRDEFADVAVAALATHRGEQVLLVLEVDVQGRLRDAGLAGDVAHARGIEAKIREHAAAAFEDLPALLGVSAGRRTPAATLLNRLNLRVRPLHRLEFSREFSLSHENFSKWNQTVQFDIDIGAVWPYVNSRTELYGSF